MVVSEGKVVEEGKHDELMAKKGAYFNLVTTQVNVDETVDNSKGKKTSFGLILKGLKGH